MRELKIQEMDLIAGGDANSCYSAMTGAGGIGAAFGGALGVFGGPIGILLGTSLFSLGAAAYAAANNPACANNTSMDGDEA